MLALIVREAVACGKGRPLQEAGHCVASVHQVVSQLGLLETYHPLPGGGHGMLLTSRLRPLSRQHLMIIHKKLFAVLRRHPRVGCHVMDYGGYNVMVFRQPGYMNLAGRLGKEVPVSVKMRSHVAQEAL